MKRIDYVVVAWGIISWIFWIWYSFVTKRLDPTVLYYAIWIGIFGSSLWCNREKVIKQLYSWKFPPILKFIILGYTAILIEEVIAAIVNNLNDGFVFSSYILHIEQFWAFNILAFTGFIFGWYVLIKTIRYSKREIFYLAGIWGIYSEGLLKMIGTNLWGVLFLFVPAILSYGIIITPAMFSVEPAKRTLPPSIKYILTYMLLFLFSIPPLLLLAYLRSHHPEFFPPM